MMRNRKLTREELLSERNRLSQENTVLHMALLDQIRSVPPDATEGLFVQGEDPQTWYLFRARGPLGGYVLTVTHDKVAHLDARSLDTWLSSDAYRSPATDAQCAIRDVIDRFRIARNRACAPAEESPIVARMRELSAQQDAELRARHGKGYVD